MDKPIDGKKVAENIVKFSEISRDRLCLQDLDSKEQQKALFSLLATQVNEFSFFGGIPPRIDLNKITKKDYAYALTYSFLERYSRNPLFDRGIFSV